ncbi:hypothetical protein [Pseudoalteromonas carrageenovora]|uniref:hypothetical protein n=1 Tax=Pseudoalteromonas carrageenovora TaxID=227 RepID=UPI0026E330DB|nr:hypothetical protein [Pseudoalteromonas carrageenovora]MDO6548267.1 hypothetical protein [Pseudoalteromonas carrageenovora]MDO6832714.1 hypothetical protein [Pseudoalteromonas carrageenovora]
MRELNVKEIQEVNGGALAFGAAIGAVAGGVSAYASGGDFGDVVAGAFMGGASGFFGGAGGMLWSAGSRLTGGAIGGSGIFFGALPTLVDAK